MIWGSILCDRLLDVDEVRSGVEGPFDWTLVEPGGGIRRVTLDLDGEEDGVYPLR